MDKDTKVLLMAVVIILVALVSFNLTDLTGKVTKGSTATITVSPSVVTFAKNEVAKMVTIKVSPGKEGINRKLEFYIVRSGSTDTRVGTESVNICRTSTCYEDVTVSYRLNSGLSGKYYFIARDRRGVEIVGKSNIIEIR